MILLGYIWTPVAVYKDTSLESIGNMSAFLALGTIIHRKRMPPILLVESLSHTLTD